MLAEVPSAGQRALVPEAEDSFGWDWGRCGSFFGDDLEAQRCPDGCQNRGGKTRDNSQRNPLREGEVFPGHAPDSTYPSPSPFLSVSIFFNALAGDHPLLSA